MIITEKSKLIANYLGWKYIPSNDSGVFKKAGWWKPVLEAKEPITIEGLGTFKAIYPQKLVLGHIESDGWWWEYVCRNHHQLRFYNSLDELIPVLNKLTEEDLKEYMYSWEDDESGTRYNFEYISYNIYGPEDNLGTIIDINLTLDPSFIIGQGKGESMVKNTFKACVEAIEYINEIKLL